MIVKFLYALHFQALPSGLHEPAEPKIRSDGYDQIAPSYHYGSPARGPTKPLSVMKANGHFSREYTVESQASTINVLPQHGFQGQFQSPPRESEFITPNEATLQMDHERKVLKYYCIMILQYIWS